MSVYKYYEVWPENEADKFGGVRKRDYKTQQEVWELRRQELIKK